VETDLNSPCPCFSQIRYSYPFLGSASPVYTAPLVVGRGSEKTFEQSFCSFEFESTWQDVRAEFSGVPMLLELLISDKYVLRALEGLPGCGVIMHLWRFGTWNLSRTRSRQSLQICQEAGSRIGDGAARQLVCIQTGLGSTRHNFIYYRRLCTRAIS
jgi:hypothetical protein